MTTCPHCHRTFIPAPKRAIARAIDYTRDTAPMTDDDLKAYRKLTAPALDCQFFFQRVEAQYFRAEYAGTAAHRALYQLRQDACDLAHDAYAGMLRAAVYDQLTRLQSRWRALDYVNGRSMTSDGMQVCMMRTGAEDVPSNARHQHGHNHCDTGHTYANPCTRTESLTQRELSARVGGEQPAAPVS